MFQKNDVAFGVRSGVPARIVKEHQGEERGRLAVKRNKSGEQAAKPDGFTAKILAEKRFAGSGGIARRENQVHGHQNRIEPGGSDSSGGTE